MIIEKIENLGVKLLGLDKIKKIKYEISFIYYRRFKKYKNKKKIIYMLTPVHGNMGDEAIALATKEYLKNEFPDYVEVEVYRKDTYKYTKSIMNILNEDDFILLHGGGNIGNLWPGEEAERRFILNIFKDQKIVSMPQTMSFTDDEEGEKQRAITKEIYDKHKNLTLIAREKRSYELMKELFDNVKIVLNPDIVLYLLNTYKDNPYKRSNVTTCIRDDKESILGEKKDVFISELKKTYNDVFVYDTVVNRTVYSENRNEELKEMLDNFFKSKVVITDRLHGMVFCALTKTPCIVTKALDHKVAGTYDWIKDLNYIFFVEDLNFDDVKDIIDKAISLEDKNSIDLRNEYFNKLRNILFNKIK